MIPKDITNLGAMIISTITMIIFIAALFVAYYLKSETALTLLFGTAAANATTIVSYWVGSSSGSVTKSQTIAEIAKQPSKE